MRVPWTEKDAKGLGEYRPCASCGGSFTRWHRKATTEAGNKKAKRLHKKEMVEYKRLLSEGKKKPNKPAVLQQASLMKACCGFQVGFSICGGLIPCGTCSDGSCFVCNLFC